MTGTQAREVAALVDAAEQANLRAEIGLRAATDGIEAAMDRLAHLGRQAAIAHAVRAEAERDRLQAFLETVGGDPADAEIVRLREELAAARAVGRCGAHADGVLADPQQACCTLPAGHPGWHRDTTTGTEWTPEPAEIEYDIEVRNDDDTWGWTMTTSEQRRNPAALLNALAAVRANNPDERFRAIARPLPPFRPLSDEQLAALAETEANR